MALPLSSITETLTYNHRLIVDSYLYNADSQPRAWLISKINRINPKGIVVVTMAQDVFDQHKDYIEKNADGKIIGMWADYYSSSVEPVEVNTSDPPAFMVTSRITCSGKPQFRIDGSAKTFTVCFLDDEENIVDDWPVGEWSFSIDNFDISDLLEISAIKSDAHKVKVKFLGGDDYIGKVVTVTNTTQGGVIGSLNVEILPL